MENEKNALGYFVVPESETANGACLECGDVIMYGRADKKFCCEACKNKYNNRRTRSGKLMKARVLHILEKNYSILRQLFKLGMVEIDITHLRHLGFDFDHMTSYHECDGYVEIWCYDMKLTVSGSKSASIMRVSCLPKED